MCSNILRMIIVGRRSTIREKIQYESDSNTWACACTLVLYWNSDLLSLIDVSLLLECYFVLQRFFNDGQFFLFSALVLSVKISGRFFIFPITNYLLIFTMKYLTLCILKLKSMVLALYKFFFLRMSMLT